MQVDSLGKVNHGALFANSLDFCLCSRMHKLN